MTSAADAKPVDHRRALIEEVSKFRFDPLGYVLFAFPWCKGELADYRGPRAWQGEFLVRLGRRLRENKITPAGAIREAVSSGHGIGKGALVAWLILWAMSTMEDTRGVVTANTEGQLKTKTWAELAKWYRLCINRDWFVFTATALYAADVDHEKTWRIDMIPWSEHNTEAFAGLHNTGRRVLLIFDEASAIADKIWEVAEGALTDDNTEIIWAVFGNPTRNTGRFRECWGKFRHRWSLGNPLQIDSRSVDGTNKIELKSWVDDYGENSDFVRVRVRGLFPSASSLQLIPSDLVHEAMNTRETFDLGDPLIMAVDVARGGDDNCVIRFRRGLDARSPRGAHGSPCLPMRVAGAEARDSMKFVAKVAEVASRTRPDVIFVDATGVGGPVADRLRQLGFNVTDVQFGSSAPDPKCANLRAYMWRQGLEWLQRGGALDKSSTLESDLTSVEYTHDKKDRLILEAKEHMKARGLASPDDGDALMMTFAVPVMATFNRDDGPGTGRAVTEYDALGDA